MRSYLCINSEKTTPQKGLPFPFWREVLLLLVELSYNWERKFPDRSRTKWLRIADENTSYKWKRKEKRGKWTIKVLKIFYGLTERQKDRTVCGIGNVYHSGPSYDYLHHVAME